MDFTDEEKKAIEYAKELRGLFSYGVGLTYGDGEDDAFRVLLNLIDRLRNKEESTCLHCGDSKPGYCEKCYQELIAENMKLQTRIKDLEEIEESHRKMNGELMKKEEN